MEILTDVTNNKNKQKLTTWEKFSNLSQWWKLRQLRVVFISVR